MTQLLDVDHSRRDELLTEAADRQVQAVISHRLDSGWTTYKSRILQADSAGGFLIIEHPQPSLGQVPPELAPGEKIGLTFRRGHKKCLCSVEIERLATFVLPDGQSVAAVQIPWPKVARGSAPYLLPRQRAARSTHRGPLLGWLYRRP